jgi:hypothetical protein
MWMAEICHHTTHWYTIFLQQPGIIKKKPDSKLDLVRYPQFFCENKIECKQIVGKYLKLRNVSSVLKGRRQRKNDTPVGTTKIKFLDIV